MYVYENFQSYDGVLNAEALYGLLLSEDENGHDGELVATGTVCIGVVTLREAPPFGSASTV